MISTPMIEVEKDCAPLLIVGAGLGGLVVALAMAPLPVVLVSVGEIGEETSSKLAQGGVAVAWSGNDSPDSHAQDTINAGAGLCDHDIVKLVTQLGKAAVQQLIEWGVAFDTNAQGDLDLSLEGAHACRRVAHIQGDGTGAGIMASLVARVRATPSIALYENACVTRILTNVDGVIGALVHATDGPHVLAASDVVLATGGASSLWAETTAPLKSWGRGLALAAQAGATLRDLCFMQFHPTGLDVGLDPMPLVSEAVRGEGAVLRNAHGKRFLESDLASRDIVSRGVWREIQKGSRVFLDVHAVPHFEDHFPAIYGFCRDANIDPMVDYIPVRPVAHYHMGGVMVDAWGRADVNGLWAVGEVASTGLHGANRLASNSLLEAVVFGLRIAERLREKEPRILQVPMVSVEDAKNYERFYNPSVEDGQRIRNLMSRDVGLWRSQEHLADACEALQPMAKNSAMGLVAMLIAKDALARQESRGAHMRLDYPYPALPAKSQTSSLKHVS